jgi:guanosine-3',5'-bis(diphosphate) 3'-pyrophosphohydrolase
MAQEARVIHIQRELVRLEMFNALRALNWMLETMNAKNGYARKDGSHYYYHLVDATQDLLNAGIRDEVTITACILHDAIEDIDGVTFDLVSSLYGYEVAHVVNLVTKVKGINYKEGTHLHTYLLLILTDVRACLVKTADRKHNFSTLDSTSAKHEERQMNETEKHFIPFFKEARKKYPEFSAYFHSAKTTIIPHLKRIKKAIDTEEKLKGRIAELELKLEQEKKRYKALEKKTKKMKEGKQIC